LSGSLTNKTRRLAAQASEFLDRSQSNAVQVLSTEVSGVFLLVAFVFEPLDDSHLEHPFAFWCIGLMAGTTKAIKNAWSFLKGICLYTRDSVYF